MHWIIVICYLKLDKDNEENILDKYLDGLS